MVTMTAARNKEPVAEILGRWDAGDFASIESFHYMSEGETAVKTRHVKSRLREPKNEKTVRKCLFLGEITRETFTKGSTKKMSPMLSSALERYQLARSQYKSSCPS